MKHTRRPLALLLGLCLAFTASTALAAPKKPSKTFTQAPTVRIVDAPSDGVESGDLDDLTIDASLPGFVTITLKDGFGSTQLTIADHKEIHSETTIFDFYAVNDDGEPLAPGHYTLIANMVSQYGVAAKEVTKDMMIVANPDRTAAAQAAASSPSKTASSSTAVKKPTVIYSTKSTSNNLIEKLPPPLNEDTKVTVSVSKPKTTPKPSGKTNTQNSDEMTYGEGAYKMGDEGLLIGVGVDDSAAQEDSGYWGLTADASDAEIWAALTRKMTGVDMGESESAYIYDSTEKNREKLGTVSGISQGLNVIVERDDGWSLVEAFRNEDGAFIRGYIRSDKLRIAEPNELYGLTIDKKTQTLTVYKEGERLGSCKVTTGLPTAKYPHRETPAGEFILVTRRGAYEYYGQGYTKYTIRLNGNYYLAELPTTKKNGTKYMDIEKDLGKKATRGTICLAHEASTDGGINAKWIWDMTDKNKRVKVLIFDDKPRTDVPISDAK